MTLPAQNARQLEASGHEHLAAKRYWEASEDLTRAVNLEPTLGSAAIALVEAYRGSGMPAEALQACQRALTVVGDDHGLRLNLAWLHFELRDYESAIREAQAVLNLNCGLELESRRSLIFSTAAAGDWAEAGRQLDLLESCFPDSLASVVAEVASTFAGDLYAAVAAGHDKVAMERFKFLPRQVALSPASKLGELQAIVAACHFRSRSFAEGLALFNGSIGNQAAIVPAMADGVALITSLMPTRFDDQKRAVASWSTLGYRIISVNDPSELAELRPMFPQVQFIQTDRNAHAEVGRPLVFIDDLLAAAKASPETTVGIINSDIVLKPSDASFTAQLKALSKTSILLGNRLDTETPDCDPDGRIYREGYDWFFFRREQIDLFWGSNLVFGAPWWDLWVPACAILSAVELISFRQPAAYHRKHATAWNAAVFQTMGRRFAAAIAKLSEARQPQSAAASALRGVSGAFTAVGGGAAAPEEAIARLSPITSAIVQAAVVVVQG